MLTNESRLDLRRGPAGEWIDRVSFTILNVIPPDTVKVEVAAAVLGAVKKIFPIEARVDGRLAPLAVVTGSEAYSFTITIRITCPPED